MGMKALNQLSPGSIYVGLLQKTRLTPAFFSRWFWKPPL